MDNQKFTEMAKGLVVNFANSHVDPTDGVVIDVDQVYVVWMCKTLQNNKALFGTTLPDGMYYEVTYNGDKNEAHLDAYKKFHNQCIVF